MNRLLKLSIVLFIADSTMVNFRVQASGKSVMESFLENKLVPDVISSPPTDSVQVIYPGGVEVKQGNELTPTQVQDMPAVSYKADPDKFYTLAMIDPDVPSRELQILGEFNHWLVGNIPGNKVADGETLSSYIGSIPPPTTGLHRYTFLVFLQPGKLTFDEKRLLNTSQELRVKFSIAAFAKKYNLGDPIAGNFFLAQFDGLVPILDAVVPRLIG